jgi:hypothetical protein
MIAKTESDVKTQFEQANEEFRRAGNHFILALDDWIEWRAEKLQGVRQEIAANTRLVGKPSLADNDLDLVGSRDRLRTTEELLHRLFPDEFADTNSAAE